MSKENEEREFEELAAMEEFEAQDQPKAPEGTRDTGELAPSEPGLAPRDRVIVSEEEKQEAAAFGMGAVEGLPFAKDSAAIIETVMTSGTQNFGEEYQTNLNEWDEAINDAEAKHPAAFMAGDIASGTLLPIKGIKGAMAFGGLSSASRLEDRNPFEVAGSLIGGSALTGTLSASMTAAGKLVGYVGGKLGALGAATTGEAVGAFAGKNIKKLNRHIRKTGTGVSQSDRTIEFAQRINNTMVDGEPLLGGALRSQSFSLTAEKAQIAMRNHGKKLGSVVDDLDAIYGDKISGKVLHDKMRSKMGIDDMLVSADPDTVLLGKQYESKIKSQFMDTIEEIVPMSVKKPSSIVDSNGNPLMVDEVVDSVKKTFKWKELSPKEVHGVKIDHGQTSRKVSAGFEKLNTAGKQRALSVDETFDTSLTSTLNDIMDDVSGTVSKTNPDLANMYRSVNRDYSDMNLVQQMAQDQADSTGGGAMRILKNALGTRGLLIANLQSSTGANAALASATGVAINQMVNNPETSVRMSKLLTKTGDHIKLNPDSPFLKRLVMAAQVSSYSPMIGDEALQEAVASIGAEISLLESPIERTYTNIEDKSDYILEALQFHNPDQATAMRKALKSGDKETVRVIMNEASKLPELQDMFVPGKGIDGRVFSPEEKAELKGELDVMDVSLNQKLKLEDNLMKNGVIPVVEEEPERFFQPKWRNKDKPRY